jgi:putative ABC transport system substrate-binding protein
MDRRSFLAASSALALATAARTSSAAEPSTVGLLWVSSSSTQRHIAFLRESLAQKGLTEPDAIRIDGSALVDRYEALGDSAKRLLARRPRVIVTYGATAPGELHRLSSAVPVVLMIGADPVKQGFAKSFAHPGGNMTGAWLVSTDSGGKRIELLQRMTSGLKRAAYFYNDQSPVEVQSVPLMVNAARSIGVTLEPTTIRLPADIEPAIAAIARSAVQGFYFASSTMFTANARAIVEAVGRTRLPAIYPNSDYTDAGGLASYGPDVPGAFRLAGEYVARILRGANPADMPIEKYSKFELVVNMRSAKAQGIDIPQSVLGLADRVIES